jgi:hypothetical protein
VTIFWTGGAVGESFLPLLDKWNMDIACCAAGRSKIMLIFKNLRNHRILGQIQLIMDLKQGGLGLGGHWNEGRV